MSQQLLVLKKDDFTLPIINFDVNKVRLSLGEALEKYDGLTFTENDVKDLKATIAELNKAEKMVEDYRKEVKKEVAAPIAEFEAKCKELVIMINERRAGFKTAAKTIEDNRVEAKRIKVHELMGELSTASLLDESHVTKVLMMSSYLTKSMTMAKVEVDLLSRIQQLEIQQQLYNAKRDQITLYCGVVSSETKIIIQSDPYVKMLDNYSVDDVKRFVDEFVVKANMVAPEPVKPTPAAPVLGFKEPITETGPELLDRLFNIKADEFIETWDITTTEELFSELECVMKEMGIKYKVKDE